MNGENDLELLAHIARTGKVSDSMPHPSSEKSSDKAVQIVTEGATRLLLSYELNSKDEK